MRLFKNMTACILTVCIFLAQVTIAYSDEVPRSSGERKFGGTKTVFVLEMVRHGARSQFSGNDIDSTELFGVPMGQLTEIGRVEASKIGVKRRIEYQQEKRLIPYKYNASAILSLSTFKPQCTKESGEKMIQAIYPLTDLNNKREVTYISIASPLKGTSFESIVNSFYTENGARMCPSGPVQRIPVQFDAMLSTKKCKNLDRYLSEDKFDTEGLEQILQAQFGADEIAQTKQEIEERFGGQQPDSLRDYTNKLDVMVAELYHTGKDSDRLESYSRQLCYITANNMYGPDEEPSKVYVSRLAVPILQMLYTVRDNTVKKRPDMLKYLILNVRDINLSNFLRFLGYWDAYGYDSNFTKFSSSLRIELIQKVEQDSTEKFYVQFIYDDEIIKFPWCQDNGYLCPLDDFIMYGQNNLIFDHEYVENFCQAKVGTNYIKMRKSNSKSSQSNK